MRKSRFVAHARALVLSVALGGLLAGCAGVPRSAVAPRVELVNLAALGAAPGGQRFELTLLVENTGAEPLEIAGIRYSARLAGQGYVNGSSDAPIVLAGASRRTVELTAESDGVASPSRLRAFVRGPDDALDYELTGEFVLGGRPPRVLSFASSGDVPFVSRGD